MNPHIVSTGLERKIDMYINGSEYNQWFVPVNIKGIEVATLNQIKKIIGREDGIFIEKINGMTLYGWKEKINELERRYFGYKCNGCGNHIIDMPIIITMDEINNDYFCSHCEYPLTEKYELIN